MLFITKKLHQRIITAKENKISELKNDLEKKDDLNKRLTSERQKVRRIIELSDITKENYFTTLEKIKKELDVGKTY